MCYFVFILIQFICLFVMVTWSYHWFVGALKFPFLFLTNGESFGWFFHSNSPHSVDSYFQETEFSNYFQNFEKFPIYHLRTTPRIHLYNSIKFSKYFSDFPNNSQIIYDFLNFEWLWNDNSTFDFLFRIFDYLVCNRLVKKRRKKKIFQIVKYQNHSSTHSQINKS